MSQDREYRLKVSQTAKVRPGVFRAQVSVVYAGMLSENIFSLAVLWSFGHNSLAYNLYLAKYQREVMIPKGKLEIIDLSAEEVRFIYNELPQ